MFDGQKQENKRIAEQVNKQVFILMTFISSSINE